MKRFVSIFMSILFIIVIILLLCGQIYRAKTTAEHYFDVIGFSNGLSFQSVSTMLNEREQAIVKNNDETVIRCQGYDIVADSSGKVWRRIEIYDPMYQFTPKSIGVGSTREDIENTYGDCLAIKDLKQNELGYIVDDLWVEFQLTEDDIAKKITLYYGP